jgi:ectoine hydroxylase-related dioxygenase (phytanoyl-CoA dioxygenase family)
VIKKKKMDASKKPAIFEDEELNRKFDKEGYVVIPDLITREVLERLNDFYKANPTPVREAFHATHFASDKAYKKRVHEAIASFLAPFVAHLLPGYDMAFGNFMVKEGGGNNPMPLHADWTYVDEQNDTSLAIWLPMVDTDMRNGCLGVIPYSQNLTWHIRGPRIKQCEYHTQQVLIDSVGKLIPLKAGGAVIYNHKLLHYSTANNSANTRPALNLSLTPKNVKVIHYTMPEGEEQVRKYEVTDFDFYIYYDNFKTPERGVLVDNMDPDNIPAFDEQVKGFIDHYSKHNVV